MSLPPFQLPPAYQALQKVGYSSDITDMDAVAASDIAAPSDSAELSNDLCLRVKLLSPNSTLPYYHATNMAAGYGLYSAISCKLLPHAITKVSNDIAIQPPIGTYAQLASRISFVANHAIVCQAGVIDADYCGNIQVLLHNKASTPYTVNKGDRIVQMLLIKIAEPPAIHTDVLSSTDQDSDGFGSTRLQSPPPTEFSRVVSVSEFTYAPYTTAMLPAPDPHIIADDLPELPYNI